MQSVQIGFQGERGAFSHRASEFFIRQLSLTKQAEFISLKSFEAVFEGVKNGICHFGAVPLENSTVGSIPTNYDFLWREPVVMEAEILLPVQHQLLGFAGAQLSQLEAVYSHPAALEQCRNFLKSLPHVKAMPFWDTSASALFVKNSRNPKFAAIASDSAGLEAGLTTLARNVEDHRDNNTRFGIIRSATASGAHISALMSDSSFAYLNVEDMETHRPYKMSCALQLIDEPGALADLLVAIATLNLNITKIESRPIPEKPWTYRFFVDIALPDSRCDVPLEKIFKSYTTAFKILGRYRNWSAVDNDQNFAPPSSAVIPIVSTPRIAITGA